MTEIPHITTQGPQRKSWRPRKQTRATLGDVLRFIGARAFGRLRRRMDPDQAEHFRHAVEFVAGESLQAASKVLVAGLDVRGRDGFRTVSTIVEGRIESSNETIAQRLREARPAIRKAIIAAAFAWLRVQFPVLNAVSAVAAAKLLSELIHHRKQ